MSNRSILDEPNNYHEIDIWLTELEITIENLKTIFRLHQV
jgi:hypothetical protein